MAEAFVTKDKKAILIDLPPRGVIMEMKDGSTVLVAEGGIIKPAKKPVQEQRGGNPNHDNLGRFARGKGGGAKNDDGGTSADMLQNATTDDLEALAKDLDLYQKNDIADRVNGDTVLNRIYDKQGFNDKPKVVSKKEFNTALDNDTPELYRGFQKKSMLNQYIDGDHYAGHGLFGSGTYASEDRKIAAKYSAEKALMKLTWDGSAKTTTYNKMTGEIRKAYTKYDYDNQPAKVQKAIDAVFGNPGRYAAMRGYDAMIVESPFGDSQFVIFNRGKVIIEGGK